MDLVNLYLRDASFLYKKPTAAEEKKLLKQVASGRWALRRLKSINKDLLSRRERNRLEYIYSLSLKAKQRLITSNLLLVVGIVRGYCEKKPILRQHLLDLIDEGNIGLIIGIEKFRFNKGAKRLSTYVTWWIKQKMILLSKRITRVVDAPNYAIIKIPRYQRAVAEIQSENGCLSARKIARKMKVKENIVKNIEYAIRPCYSASCLNENDERCFNNIRHPSKNMEEDNSEEITSLIINNLRPREAFVIITRFGLSCNDSAFQQLDQKAETEGYFLGKWRKLRNQSEYNGRAGSNVHTLKEIGDVFGVCKERIRQIECRARRKLKDILRDYNPNPEA